MAKTLCLSPLICEICGICGSNFGIQVEHAAPDRAGARPYQRIARKSHERVGSSAFRAKPLVLRTSNAVDAASIMAI
jgi:hypothetical protein